MTLLSRQELTSYLQIVDKVSEGDRKKIKALLEMDRVQRCRESFLFFVKQMWPMFISGKHHQIMADAFERVANGELKRLIINMPPRHTKSEFASYLLPAWFLGKFPEKKIIQTAHTAELAVGFGRKVRNLVSSEDYGKVFQTKLSSDSKAAGRWNTDKGGDYFAIGTGGAVTGKGADLLIIDDPHSEQEAKQGNPAVYDAVYEWYTSGPRQRLQPGGSIIVVMTRWSKRDLTGQLLKNSSKDGTDDWEVIEFPAILPSGTPLWPGFWKKEELESIKAEIPVAKWEAQYQQNPTSEEGALIKREYWKIWEKNTPPSCQYIIQSWDTAFETSNRADYSACTTWGVFEREDRHGNMVPNIILLDALKIRLEFPDLKKKAIEMYREWNPDTTIIEKRAAGAPLVYELRKAGVPVSEYTPYKGQDKIARVNSITDLFASGMVWRPETRWAEEVMEEMAEFPHGEHDDLTDSASQALMRFRKGGFISIETDEPEETVERRRVEYY
jgi:predicted phage terminase large subunit-like protein